jgi:hypothetical protein
MDADAVGMEEIIAEIELVEGEGDEERCEVRGRIGGANECEDEVWSGVGSQLCIRRCREGS